MLRTLPLCTLTTVYCRLQDTSPVYGAVRQYAGTVFT